MNDAEDRLALVQQRNEGAEQRAGRGERLGPINRIEHPDEISGRVFVAEFFADHAMGWEPFGDELAKQLFGATVGGGDGGVIGFRFDDQIRLRKKWPDKIPTAFGELCNE